MIGLAYLCDGCGRYHIHYFTPPYLPSVEDDFKGIAYWFDEWGFNPYDTSGGTFNAEWN
jgi:hypothetical protein